MIQPIETERLTLRQLIPNDAAALVKLHSIPENIAFIGKGSLSEAETRAKIAVHVYENEPFGLGLRAVIVRGSGEIVGRAGLFRSVIEGADETELAYLIDRDHWGRGLATETCMALLEDGINVLGITRIIAIIHPENTNSLRVAEKCGFRHERDLASYKDFGRVELLSITNPDRISRI